MKQVLDIIGIAMGIILVLGVVYWAGWDDGTMNEWRKREQRESITEKSTANANPAEQVTIGTWPTMKRSEVEKLRQADTDIDTKQCFYRLAPYTTRWRNVADRWEAFLYVPAGMGEAVKEKVESLDFVDGVLIRNSELYEHPADDRLEVELSKRADKDHAEMLDTMLPGIMDAVKEGL